MKGCTVKIRPKNITICLRDLYSIRGKIHEAIEDQEKTITPATQMRSPVSTKDNQHKVYYLKCCKYLN